MINSTFKRSVSTIFLMLFIIGLGFSQNLIPNPGFELGTGDDFTSWSKYNGASSLIETTDPAEIRSGLRALKVVVTTSGNPWEVQLVSDAVPTTIGDSYTFSVYVKALTAATGAIRFSTTPNAQYSANYDLGTDYTKISYTFTANAATTSIALDLGANANTYLFDDMELTGPPSTTTAANLLNPGFELGTGDEFDNWGKWNGATSVVAGVATGEFRTGSRALKAVVATDGNPWETQVVSDPVPTTIGTVYTVKLWAKTLTGASSFRMSTNPNALYSGNYTPGTDWTLITWSFTANASETRLALDLGAMADTYYIDDIEINFPTPPPALELLNPDFEEGSGNVFTNWTKTNGASSLLETTVAGEFYSGSRGLKAIIDGNQANAGNSWSVQMQSAPIPTEIGQTYTIRLWAKALTAGESIQFSTSPSPIYSAPYEISDEWTQYSWTFIANEENTIFSLDLGQHLNTYYIDALSIEVLPSDCQIADGGFEEGTGNSFTNWDLYGNASLLSATTTAGEFRSGVRGAKASIISAGNPWDAQFVSKYVPVYKNATYTFSVYVKADNAGTNFRFSTSSTGGASPYYSPNYSSNLDWTLYEYTFIANSDSMRIFLDMAENVNTYYIDDACLTLECTPLAIAPVDQVPIAAGKEKFLGNVYSASQIINSERYFNQVTPENSGKWGSVETTDNVFNWTDLDAARAYAHNNGFPFRFHVLLWGAQQPTWLKPLSDSLKIVNIKEWFQAVHDHFDGSSPERAKLEYIEVLNEILNDPPNNIDNSLRPSYPFSSNNSTDAASGDYLNALRSLNTELSTSPGTYDWVINAFKLARKTFGCDVKLILNEYGIENDAAHMADYREIIQALKEENLVDIVGMQAHSFSTQKYNNSQTYESHTAFLAQNLDSLASEGLPIMITELDIDGDSRDSSGVRIQNGTQAQKDAFQLSEYQRIFGLYWNHPSVIGITLWGHRTGMWRAAQQANLLDLCSDGERPALSSYLNKTIRNSNPAIGNEFQPAVCFKPADTTVICASNIPISSTASLATSGVYCPGEVTVTVADEMPETIPTTGSYTIMRIWSITDACGNANQAKQKITVLIPDNNVTVESDLDNGSRTTGALQTITSNVKVGDASNPKPREYYFAGNSITLNAGFEVLNGSVFKAEIKQCSND